MYDTLSDLRILRLALAVEHAFEDYESSLLAQIDDPNTREALEPLFVDGPAHKRLAELHHEFEERATEALTIENESALQVMLECERSARDLYLRYLDRVKDPRLVELLRRLAHEEEEHATLLKRTLSRIRMNNPAMDTDPAPRLSGGTS
jgi:rubrerythrin